MTKCKPSDNSIRNHRAPKTPWARYPLEALGASSFAEQAYCEKRVELWLDDPGKLISIPKRVEGTTPAATLRQEVADLGTQFHQSASEHAQPVARSQIMARLRAGESMTLVETAFSGAYGNLPLIGVPDVVCFRGCDVACVIEYKVTDSNQLHANHRVQLLLYGYLLEQESFRVRELLLICALIPRAYAARVYGFTARQADEMIAIIHTAAAEMIRPAPSRQSWYQANVRIDRDLSVRLRVFKYDRQSAERALQFFSEFWLGRRPAKPAAKPSKCKVCLYNACSLCPAALVPYAGVRL
jgi:CRISPR/Cas system-associated exonuclease Cas4 (RecB family)